MHLCTASPLYAQGMYYKFVVPYAAPLAMPLDRPPLGAYWMHKYDLHMLHVLRTQEQSEDQTRGICADTSATHNGQANSAGQPADCRSELKN